MPSPRLTPHETDVLRVLAEAKVTNTVITLAADLWRTTDDWEPFDIEPLVTWAVESLCEQGLVTYGLSDIVDDVWVSGHRQTQPVKRTIPVSIRLTTAGWETAGYPRMFHEAGRRALRGMPGRPGDMTDFKNHSFDAQGGPIEKEDFATHQDHYPHHIHDYAMKGDLDDMARSYLRITPEIEASVLAARSVLGVNAAQSDIADLSGIPIRTVKYVETDMPRLRRLGDGELNVAASLKQRIIWLLEEMPEGRDFTDVRELSRVLGRADTDHDIVHVLHSLHTQGRVDFKEDGRGDAPINIHLRRKGSSKRKENGVTVAPTPEAPVEPEVITPRVPDETPTASFSNYPLLDELLDRERNRQEADTKAMAYVNAAEALTDVDPDAAAALMRKAEAFNVVFPSPLEQEYIRYVAAHPGKVSDG